MNFNKKVHRLRDTSIFDLFMLENFQNIPSPIIMWRFLDKLVPRIMKSPGWTGTGPSGTISYWIHIESGSKGRLLSGLNIKLEETSSGFCRSRREYNLEVEPETFMLRYTREELLSSFKLISLDDQDCWTQDWKFWTRYFSEGGWRTTRRTATRWRGSIVARLEVFPRNQRLLESGVYEFTVVM